MAKFSATALGTAMLSLGITLSSATSAPAAIIGVDDSGSPFGQNTIANLGFNLSNVIDSTAVNDTQVSSLLSSVGIEVNFNPVTIKRTVPSGGWQTWSNGYEGPVYFGYFATSLTLNFSSPVTAFDFYAEPDPFDFFDITAVTSSGSVLMQSVNGRAGAKYFGFYSDNLIDTISSITISSSEKFAVGQMRLSSAATQAIPTPALLPGLIGFAVSVLRRQKAEAGGEADEA